MATNTTTTPTIRVLFVCLGNICRSPMAHAVFEDMVSGGVTHPSSSSSQKASASTSAGTSSGNTDRVTFGVDSAGTGAYHSGDMPDSRTLRTLGEHGIEGFAHAARMVRTRDFVDFDYVLAMDEDNLEDLADVRRRARREFSNVEGVGDGGMATLAMFGAYDAGNVPANKKMKKDSGGNAKGEEIADPYYGGGKGFETAYKQCVRFSKGFLNEVIGEGWEDKVGGGKL